MKIQFLFLLITWLTEFPPLYVPQISNSGIVTKIKQVEHRKHHIIANGIVNGKNFEKAQIIIPLKEVYSEDTDASYKLDNRYQLACRVFHNHIVNNSLNWDAGCYHDPIAFDHFRLTAKVESPDDNTSSPTYQNSEWKTKVIASQKAANLPTL